MHYRQITSPERYLISTLRQWGFTPAQTATVLGRHRSSITREIRRNATRADGCYRPFTASERARGRRSRSRCQRRAKIRQFRRLKIRQIDRGDEPQVVAAS